jgi:hypothetical protein
LAAAHYVLVPHAAPSSQRVFLHIGLHKSGTTFLQETFKANAATLRQHGIYYPAGKSTPSVLRAVDDLHGRRQVKADSARAAGAWSALVAAARASGARTVLLSDERLSLSGMPALRAVKRSFEPDELVVVVTVRDLARTLASSWEESIRGGASWTWDEYVAAVRDPDRRGINPARGFWVRQDLAHITAAWEAVVAKEDLRLVTVPPPHAKPGELLDRFCAAVGIDAGLLPEPPARRNPAVGFAGTEMLRRFNARFGGQLDRRAYDRAVKYAIVPKLAERPVGGAAFDSEAADWLRRAAATQIAATRERGYPVVGDLDDLRPMIPESAEQVAEHDIAAAAVTALGALVLRQGTLARAGNASGGPDVGGGKVGSRLREAGFRARRWVLARGDRGGPLGSVVFRAYQVREWRQERAMRAARERR